MSRHVLVIGAGVIGLTTALALLRKGLRVTIVADRFPPDLTSVVAGALWEWPPAVCGHHRDPSSLSRSKEWCLASYRAFADLARDPDTGVFVRQSIFYFRQPITPDSRPWSKMQEVRTNVPGFRHDASLIQEQGINPYCGVVDAYAHLAPMIDTDVYLEWLRKEADRHQCVWINRRISGKLIECAAELQAEFKADVIINCAGLGAKELGDDSVYPLRGALVRVLNTLNPPLENAHCVSASDDSEDMVFIVPRGRSLIVLGGLIEPEEWTTEISLANYAPIRKMYERCLEFLPRLRSAAIDTTEPVRVGLRPARRENVRLEWEHGMPVIHCYGHGGSGVTLSWGCAAEVASMVLGDLRPDWQ